MNVLPEPSPWFFDRFGEHSQRVMLALASAGRATHERSLDAKTGSQLATNEAYGSFWVSLPQEVVEHLNFLPGREVIRPSGSRYELLVFERTLIFPAKCGPGSAGADRLKLGQSEFRRRVFSLEEQLERDVQEQFDLGPGFEGNPISAVMGGSFGSANRVLLVAYDCSARGGLRHVYIGDANLDTSGLVIWHHREELPLHLLDGEGAILVGLDDAPATRFDHAPIPESDLTLLTPNELSDEEEADNGIANTGTGGGDDGQR